MEMVVSSADQAIHVPPSPQVQDSLPGAHTCTATEILTWAFRPADCLGPEISHTDDIL